MQHSSLDGARRAASQAGQLLPALLAAHLHAGTEAGGDRAQVLNPEPWVELVCWRHQVVSRRAARLAMSLPARTTAKLRCNEIDYSTVP